jgi:hypothetical protein
MSALNSLGLEEISSQIKEKRDEAFQSYRIARIERDSEKASTEWARYGELDDASLRLDRAVETAKALLGSET